MKLQLICVRYRVALRVLQRGVHFRGESSAPPWAALVFLSLTMPFRSCVTLGRSLYHPESVSWLLSGDGSCCLPGLLWQPKLPLWRQCLKKTGDFRECWARAGGVLNAGYRVGQSSHGNHPCGNEVTGIPSPTQGLCAHCIHCKTQGYLRWPSVRCMLGG